MTSTCRLPGPVADLWDWQFDGSCRRGNPEVFFHPDGERGPSRRNRDRAAKAVCVDCPVLQNCRSHALQVREPYGVWGGMTERERDSGQTPNIEGWPRRARTPGRPT
jgi:WhiB family redox-sensing transcriptional regulator